MQRVIFSLLFFALLAGFGRDSNLAAADRSASLHGLVRGSDGKPVSGAVIKIHNLEKGITVTVFSEKGSYRFSDLSSGRSEILAGLGGYAPSFKKELDLSPGKDSAYDIQLPEESARPITTPADWIPALPDDHDGAKELFVNRCVNCHGPAEPFRLRLDRLNWKKVVVEMNRMYRVEASVPPAYRNIPDAEAMKAADEETERLADYLVKHFGSQAPPQPHDIKPASYRSVHTDANVIITQFDIPTQRAMPHNVTFSGQGEVWFSERNGNKIGRLDPQTGQFKEFPIPSGLDRPTPTMVDKKGMVWWGTGDTLGRLDPHSGEMKQYALPRKGSGLHSVFIGPDGTLWMSENAAGRIASFNPQTESFQEYPIQTPHSRPYGIVVDSHNHVWFCEFGGDKIGRLDAATGAIQEYEPPTAHSGPRRPTLDRENNLWFTEYNVSKIARLNHDTGKITEWDVPTRDSGPYDIVIDPRGKVWFDEFTSNKVVRFDPATAQFTEYPLPGVDSQVRKMSVDPAGGVWLAEYTNGRIIRVVEKR